SLPRYARTNGGAATSMSESAKRNATLAQSSETVARALLKEVFDNAHTTHRRSLTTSLASSLIHSTELATALQNSQSPLLSATVPNARWRNGACTTSTCSATDPPIAIHSHWLVNRCAN